MLNNLVPMPGMDGRQTTNEGLQMDQRTIKSVNVTSTSETMLGKDKAQRKARVATVEVGHTRAKGTLDDLAFNQTTSTTTKVQTTDSQGTQARPILSHNTQNLHGVVRVEGWTKHLPKKPVTSGSIGTLRPIQISVKNVRPIPQTRPVQQVRRRPAQSVRPQRNPQSIRAPPRHVRPQRCSPKCCRCVPCRSCSRKPAPRARNPAPIARNPAPAPIARNPAPAPAPIARNPAN
ncbi:hypothetical protein Pcinc_026741 [Petrolisthes cinctipes]|uniref:Uncharacterized protein n=1 Tax=Petrolisthes cinctipes TaxID=88211 RepID=A0AAE1K9N1_PETCI|nr:hypothetical protein Pcinc_026741 [Petrolisthes cinctipes]